MAYAFTVTSTIRRQKDRRAILIIKIAETGASNTDTWNTSSILSALPRSGKITYQAQLVSGAGATIQPRFGKVTGWSDDTIDDIDGSGLAAAYVSEGTGLNYRFSPGQTATLFGQSKVSSGSDNVITTLLTIEEV